MIETNIPFTYSKTRKFTTSIGVRIRKKKEERKKHDYSGFTI